MFPGKLWRRMGQNQATKLTQCHLICFQKMSLKLRQAVLPRNLTAVDEADS